MIEEAIALSGIALPTLVISESNTWPLAIEERLDTEDSLSVHTHNYPIDGTSQLPIPLINLSTRLPCATLQEQKLNPPAPRTVYPNLCQGPLVIMSCPAIVGTVAKTYHATKCLEAVPFGKLSTGALSFGRRSTESGLCTE